MGRFCPLLAALVPKRLSAAVNYPVPEPYLCLCKLPASSSLLRLLLPLGLSFLSPSLLFPVVERSGGSGVAIQIKPSSLFSPPFFAVFLRLPSRICPYDPTSFQSPMNQSECFTMPGVLSEQPDTFGLKKRKRNVAQEEAINLADP